MPYGLRNSSSSSIRARIRRRRSRIHDGDNAAVAITQVPLARRVDGLSQLRHAPQPLPQVRRQTRERVPAARAQRRSWRTERQQPHHRAHFQARGAPVGQAEHVVVEAVLLVPHAFLADPVHGVGNPKEVLDELW